MFSGINNNKFFFWFFQSFLFYACFYIFKKGKEIFKHFSTDLINLGNTANLNSSL